jgi:hypothetical protein
LQPNWICDIFFAFQGWEAKVPIGKSIVAKGEREEQVEDLIRLSRLAIARSWALLARVGHPGRHLLGRATVALGETMTGEELELKHAVEDTLKAPASLSYTAPVRHMFGTIIWEGRVSIFDVHGHPTTTRAYAWISDSAGARQSHVVLHKAGIIGPADAVRAQLMGDGAEPRF